MTSALCDHPATRKNGREVARLVAGPQISAGGGAGPEAHARLLVPTLVAAGALMAVVSSLGAPLIPDVVQG